MSTKEEKKESKEKEDQGSSHSRYAVFELYAEFARVTLVGVASDSTCSVERTKIMSAPARFSAGAYAQVVEALIEALDIPEESQAIVIFDTHEAVLMQGIVSLQRADWNAEITMPELENAVRHGVWQLFQQDRLIAARFLKVQDSQLKLADVDVMQLKLDNHKVISPIGFRSHVISCLLRETFVRSEPWQQVVGVLTPERIISVVERSGFWAGQAALIAKEPALFLDVGPVQTGIYSVAEGVVTFIDTVLWGTAGVFGSVAKQFGVPIETAPEIINRYAMRQVSAVVAHAIEEALHAEFAVLMHTIEARRTKKNMPVYLHSVVPLPPLLSQDKLMRTLGITSPYIVLTDAIPVVHYNKNVPRGGLAASYDTAITTAVQVVAGLHVALVTKTAKQRARWISGTLS